MKKNPLNIVILGPQGSGKGTQAELLEKTLHLEHVETGRIFRAMAQQKTALGKKIHYFMNVKGHLLSSGFVIKVLKAHLSKISRTKGLIFDGYPRNLIQAKALDKILESIDRHLTHVIYLPVRRSTTIRRLSLRRTCSQCNRKYILGVNLPPRQTICPNCGGLVEQREDDKPQAIKRRLFLYDKQTKPLIDYYKHRGILIKIDGEPPIPRVSRNILKHFI